MKRIGLICIALLVALSVMGAGYAWWTQSLELTGTVSAGKLDWIFVSGFGSGDTGTDQNCAPGDFENPYPIQYDVGSTTGVIRQSDKHYLDVTVSNTYIGYYTELTAIVKNIGTMPIKIAEVVLHYNGTDYTLQDGEGINTNDGVFQFRWIGSGVTQIAYQGATTVVELFQIIVVNPEMSTPGNPVTYDFSITLNGEQFNATP